MEKRTRLCEWRPPILYPLDTLIQNLQTAITRTEQHTAVKRAGRLHGWLRALEALRGCHPRTATEGMVRAIQANLERVAEGIDLWEFPLRDSFRSLLEARMFVHIVFRLEKKLRPLHWKALVQGALRPEDDGESTPHRDYLLELYVASTAEAAGMAVELTEPDVIVSVAGQTLGIAAKRVKSRKKLLANAKKAARQIEFSAAEKGVVFIDVSHLMNENAVALRYLRGTPDQDGSGSVHGKLMRFGSEERAIQEILALPQVEGIILRHAVPAIIAKSFIPATLETWSPVVENPSDLTVAVFGRMLDALSPPFPDTNLHLSGAVPCEFSYAHPYSPPSSGRAKFQYASKTQPRVRVRFPNGLESFGTATSTTSLEIEFAIGMFLEFNDVITINGQPRVVTGLSHNVNAVASSGSTTVTHRTL